MISFQPVQKLVKICHVSFHAEQLLAICVQKTDFPQDISADGCDFVDRYGTDCIQPAGFRNNIVLEFDFVILAENQEISQCYH